MTIFMRRIIMKRNSKQKLEDECDALWRKIVKIRARYKCQLCGNGTSDAHHIAGRSGSVVYDLSNGISLCRKCHDHPQMGIMNAKIIKVIGQAEFDRLEAKARQIKKWNIPDLIDLKQSLKEILHYYKTHYKDSIK